MQYTDEPRDVLAQYSDLVSVQVPVELDSTGSLEISTGSGDWCYSTTGLCRARLCSSFVLTGREDASRRCRFCLDVIISAAQSWAKFHMWFRWKRMHAGSNWKIITPTQPRHKWNRRLIRVSQTDWLFGSVDACMTQLLQRLDFYKSWTHYR